jgi:hypothetical protein
MSVRNLKPSMQKLSKLIFKGSIMLIILIIAVSIIGHFLPLEFTNDHIQECFEQFRFYALPILILLTLFGTLNRQDTSAKILKIVATITASFFTLVILFFSAFSGMCRWTNGDILFQNKTDKRVSIILREFGCGATDSGSPTYKVCKVEMIAPGLMWISNVDTTKLNKNMWQRAERRE